MVKGAEPSRLDEPSARICDAALDLFEEVGYERTTVEAIAERAGVSRRTFFHVFPTKDAVIFWPHHQIYRDAGALLAASARTDPVDDVVDALHLVLSRLVADPDFMQRRYRVTRSTPALRARELAWVHEYQRMFAQHLIARSSRTPGTELWAQVLAAAMVAAHNQVLRAWLRRGGKTQVRKELNAALDLCRSSWPASGTARDGGVVMLAVLDKRATEAQVLEAFRRATARGSQAT